MGLRGGGDRIVDAVSRLAVKAGVSDPVAHALVTDLIEIETRPADARLRVSRPRPLALGLTGSALFISIAGNSAVFTVPYALLVQGENQMGLALLWVTPDGGAVCIRTGSAPGYEQAGRFFAELKQRRDDAWMAIPRAAQLELVRHGFELGMLHTLRRLSPEQLADLELMQERWVGGSEWASSGSMFTPVNSPLPDPASAISESASREPAVSPGPAGPSEESPVRRRPQPKRR